MAALGTGSHQPKASIASCATDIVSSCSHKRNTQAHGIKESGRTARQRAKRRERDYRQLLRISHAAAHRGRATATLRPVCLSVRPDRKQEVRRSSECNFPKSQPPRATVVFRSTTASSHEGTTAPSFLLRSHGQRYFFPPCRNFRTF